MSKQKSSKKKRKQKKYRKQLVFNFIKKSAKLFSKPIDWNEILVYIGFKDNKIKNRGIIITDITKL